MDDTATKRCTKCGETKPLTEFYPRSSKDPNGTRRAICKACAAKDAASRYIKGPSIQQQIIRHTFDPSFQLSPEAEAVYYKDEPPSPEYLEALEKHQKQQKRQQRRERAAERRRVREYVKKFPNRLRNLPSWAEDAL